MTTSIQDRTSEFRSILQQAQRRQATSKIGVQQLQQQQQQQQQQRQSLLTPQERQAAAINGTGTAADAASRQRSEFARRAAEIGRGISGTMAKLERLAQLAKRKTLFDDRPVEINELTFVIKQDVSALTGQIGALEALSRQQHPNAHKGGGGGGADQEGEHNNSVVFMLKGKLKDVSLDFKEVLEVRTRNIQASRSRTENFISSVSAHGNPAGLDPAARTDSPLYQTPKSRLSPKPGFTPTPAAQSDLLSLDPASSSSALSRVGGGGGGVQSDSQLLMMEEAQPQNTYIQQRGEAIETIERTIAELGGIFGQLAQMVSEQGEMVQRIDANTEDVVTNVEGAQRELLKYWSRVQGNRWLVAKMFGVLMIFFLLWVLIAG